MSAPSKRRDWFNPIACIVAVALAAKFAILGGSLDRVGSVLFCLALAASAGLIGILESLVFDQRRLIDRLMGRDS